MRHIFILRGFGKQEALYAASWHQGECREFKDVGYRGSGQIPVEQSDPPWPSSQRFQLQEMCRVGEGCKAGAHRLPSIIQPRAHLLRALLLGAQQWKQLHWNMRCNWGALLGRGPDPRLTPNSNAHKCVGRPDFLRDVLVKSAHHAWEFLSKPFFAILTGSLGGMAPPLGTEVPLHRLARM